MNREFRQHRGIAALVAILALFHAQVIFACGSSKSAGMHPCCPMAQETHVAHQDMSGDLATSCHCDQKIVATVDAITKISVIGQSDSKTVWDMPFSTNHPGEVLVLVSNRTHHLVHFYSNFHSGNQTYLLTKRLRI